MAKQGYKYAVGRRKTATARVRFYEGGTAENGGKHNIVVNEATLEEFFPESQTQVVIEPITALAAALDGYFSVKVNGGGVQSQAEAVRHGIARLLVQLNEEWKPVLRQKGFLTRDPRMKERKKPGLRRARRAPQWSKR